MVAEQKTSSNKTPKGKKPTGKTVSYTPREAIEILASALKICQKAGVEVQIKGSPCLVACLPKVQVIDGKLIIL